MSTDNNHINCMFVGSCVGGVADGFEFTGTSEMPDAMKFGKAEYFGSEPLLQMEDGTVVPVSRISQEPGEPGALCVLPAYYVENALTIQGNLVIKRVYGENCKPKVKTRKGKKRDGEG